MLNSFALLKIAGKASFILLRNIGGLYSQALGGNVVVQNLFYNHISTYEKKRTKQELINRILIIPLIPEILQKGELVETRILGNSKTYRITFLIHHKNFSVIVIHNTKGDFLLSCFQDF